MELDTKKIKRMLKEKNLTYLDVANIVGLKNKQIIFYYLKSKSLRGAEVFAKVLEANPKDLIK